MMGRPNPNKGKGAGLKFIQDHVDYKGDDCVLWPLFILYSGYGIVGFDGKSRQAHRYMCELAHGPAPTPKHQAAHSCHVRHCINPNHLRWKTVSGNMLDKRDNGTAGRKINWTNKGKLTAEQVAEIRRLKGVETQMSMADRFNVTQATIRNIYRGKTYTGKVTDWSAINKLNSAKRWGKARAAASPLD